MTEAVQLPAAFGVSWGAFIDEWCLGTAPVTPPSECGRALHALVQHWPEHVQTLVAAPIRGLGIVIGAIDIGLILADTAGLFGFEAVLGRVRTGERSALSELTAAATFSRLGFCPSLGVAAGSKVPDFALKVGNASVYTEVIAPDRAEIIKSTTDRINEIASAIVAACPESSVELFLDCDLDTVDATTVSVTIRDAPHLEETEEIPSIGRFTKRPFSFPPMVTPSIDSRTTGTVLAAARGVLEGTSGVLAVVRIAVFDGRAKRVLAGELHHFSKLTPNVLVINAGNVPGGVQDWVPSITRCLQPGQNTRISAVLLYQTGIVGEPIDVYRAWRVLVNPYAVNSLPSELLAALLTLPEKWPA